LRSCAGQYTELPLHLRNGQPVRQRRRCMSITTTEDRTWRRDFHIDLWSARAHDKRTDVRGTIFNSSPAILRGSRLAERARWCCPIWAPSSLPDDGFRGGRLFEERAETGRLSHGPSSQRRLCRFTDTRDNCSWRVMKRRCSRIRADKAA